MWWIHRLLITVMGSMKVLMSHNDLVYSLRWPVNRCNDYLFDDGTLLAANFKFECPKWPLGKIGYKAECWHSIPTKMIYTWQDREVKTMCHFSSPHSWPITCSKSVWCQTQFPVRTLNYKYIKLTLHTYHCHSVIRLWIHLIFKIKPVELQMIYIISSDHSKKKWIILFK